ncbi:MAG: hypothetical protein A07HR60_02575 [uncultured archaeon A07HR60]|nr:MAG: hypothetical protein A07HR60_02575 [uncultured archaeon A07HR60]
MGTDVIIVLHLAVVWEQQLTLTRKTRSNSINTPYLKQQTMTVGVLNCGRQCISGVIRERSPAADTDF